MPLDMNSSPEWIIKGSKELIDFTTSLGSDVKARIVKNSNKFFVNNVVFLSITYAKNYFRMSVREPDEPIETIFYIEPFHKSILQFGTDNLFRTIKIENEEHVQEAKKFITASYKKLKRLLGE